MLAWLLAMASFGNPSVTILQEATRGTLEQLYLTPYRTWKIMFSRIVSQLLLTAIMAFILIVIIQITTNQWLNLDRKSTRLNSSHVAISYAVFCLKKKM